MDAGGGVEGGHDRLFGYMRYGVTLQKQGRIQPNTTARLRKEKLCRNGCIVGLGIVAGGTTIPA